MDWWVSVHFGRLSTVISLPVSKGQEFNTYKVLDPVNLVTREHISATKKALLDLANKISFRFSVVPKPDNYVFGTQHRSKDGSQRIGLSRGFQEFITGGAIANASPSQQLRFQFFFAVNAVHEVAHAFYDSTRSHLQKPHREPYFSPELHNGLLDPEIGSCWERHVFGGKIQPNLEGPDRSKSPESCFYGLRRFDGPGDGEDSGAIPMGYISSMMLKSRWDKVNRLGACVLKCPKPTLYAMDCSVGP
jgi:hypothetical protein